MIKKAPGSTSDIVNILKERKVDVVINYLPVGSEQATKWYVEQVLAAKCAFVNCIPVFIAKEDYWQKRFKEARKNGDDIDGLNNWNIRWVGPDGYQGIVARQLQDFKKAQKERSEEDA